MKEGKGNILQRDKKTYATPRQRMGRFVDKTSLSTLKQAVL